MQANSSPSAQRDWNLGMALTQKAQWVQAAQAFSRATRAAPGDSLYWLNLAHAQRRAGRLAPAVASVRRCLALAPKDPLALRLLGDCLLQLHRYADAAAAFVALQAAGHSETEAMLQHASALLALGRPAEASAVLLRALVLDPALVPGHAMLADACRDQGLKREAVECMKTVLALQPGNLEAMAQVSFEKRHVLDWTDLDADVQGLCEGLRTKPADQPCKAATFSLLSLPVPPALQLVAARGEALAILHDVQVLPPLKPASRNKTARSDQLKGKGQRIRLGLVSHDFREHPVSQLLVDVLEQLDRSRFELHLYSSGPDDGSPLRTRVVAAAHEFVELKGLSDAQAAQRIRADGIDLLVDLMGQTRGHRLGIAARRPAPVQATYLGFPGSTGLAGIDYIVGDPLVTPIELAANYSEKLAQLPLTLQPNGTGRPIPQDHPRPWTRAQAGLPEGAFVMCAFNHTYKILPEAFDTWCGLLRELPQAVLWLKETNAQLHGNVLRAAAERGVAAERIVFAPALPYADHFSRLALADLFVDTWPYNAHTTASDALWAGVPVVTCFGSSYASRVAASVLNAAGLGELAFGSVADYRCAILALALEPELLAGYRQHLIAQRRQLPLFDTARYTRELEDLFTRMVARWRDGLAPEHLLAEPLQPAPAPAA